MRAIRGLVLAVLLAGASASLGWTQEEVVCPSCGMSYPAGTQYCLHDGARLTPKAEKCPQCGAPRLGKSKYCGACGWNFERPAEVKPTGTKPPSTQSGERICPKCGRKAIAGTKFCSGCGATLPPEGSPAATGGGSAGSGIAADAGDRQWVASVAAVSSQGGAKSFSAGQIVGPPDVQRPGRDGKAWCPSLARRGLEWITVRFARKAAPRAIRIHETSAQGFVVRIDAVVDGREVLWWEAEDRATARQPILEAVSTESVGAIDTIKITIDTKKIRAWTEIDAVELIAGTDSGTRSSGRREGLERVPPRPSGEREAEGHEHGGGSSPPAGEETRGSSEGTAAEGGPDDCFEAWRRAILDYDSRALAACYAKAERRAIEEEPEVAQAVFSRYGEAMRRRDYTVTSRTAEEDEVIWVVDIRVKEASWARRVEEELHFRREDGTWRLRVERGH